MEQQIDRLVNGYERIIVYGAGIIARAAVLTLKAVLKDDSKLECCAVTNLNHNPQSVEGVPVREIGSLLKYKDNSIILVAAKKCMLKK